MYPVYCYTELSRYVYYLKFHFSQSFPLIKVLQFYTERLWKMSDLVYLRFCANWIGSSCHYLWVFNTRLTSSGCDSNVDASHNTCFWNPSELVCQLAFDDHNFSPALHRRQKENCYDGSIELCFCRYLMWVVYAFMRELKREGPVTTAADLLKIKTIA